MSAYAQGPRAREGGVRLRGALTRRATAMCERMRWVRLRPRRVRTRDSTRAPAVSLHPDEGSRLPDTVPRLK